MAMVVDSADTTRQQAYRDRRCAHCGLPVADANIPPDDHAFCCAGCRTAWELIHEHGLDAYYRLQQADDSNDPARYTVRDRRDDGADFEYLDDPAFRERYVTTGQRGLARITLALEGIHCAACVWLLEKLPLLAPGVVSARVNWSRQTLDLEWEPEATRLSDVATVVHRLGYTPIPLHASRGNQRRQAENRQQLIRLGIAAACAGNNMLLAAALYFGMFSDMAAEHVTMFRYYSAVIGLIAVLGPGRVFFRGAWSALRTWTPHMDLPVSLGLGLGTLQGLYYTIIGGGEVYFDSLSILVFVLLLGRWLQFRQQGRAADALELLFQLTPRFAKRVADGHVVRVTIDQLQAGDTIEVLTDELFPADGVIIDGRTLVDESLLNGESLPIEKQTGQTVAAGTRNLSAPVKVRVEAAGKDTRVHRLVQLVEQAGQQRSRIVQWADRVGGWFVLVAILAAASIAVVWGAMDHWSTGLDRAIALLIVACPCALALATPLAISVALGRAARRHLMIKDGDAFEKLSGQGRLWLDKTGTITLGRLSVVDWRGDRRWIPHVGRLEQMAPHHPVARALIEFADQYDQPSESPCDVSDPVLDIQRRSDGIRAVVSGHDVAVGNAAAMADWGFAWDDAAGWEPSDHDLANDRLAPHASREANSQAGIGMNCFLGVDGRVAATIELADRIRPDAPEAIRQLQQLGWRVGILSGDHPAVVDSVARSLGLEPDDCHGGLTPEEKVYWVQRSTGHQTTVVVGDGVNDSAALAAASVGIAVKSGAEASLQAAPVYLGQAGLMPLVKLIHLARRTRKTIATNLSVSLLYNVLAASGAALGWITPLIAAFIMPISSLSVVAISFMAGATREDE